MTSHDPTGTTQHKRSGENRPASQTWRSWHSRTHELFCYCSSIVFCYQGPLVRHFIHFPRFIHHSSILCGGLCNEPDGWLGKACEGGTWPSQQHWGRPAAPACTIIHTFNAQLLYRERSGANNSSAYLYDAMIELRSLFMFNPLSNVSLCVEPFVCILQLKLLLMWNRHPRRNTAPDFSRIQK